MKNYLDWKQEILLVHFVIRAVKTDTIAFYEQEPQSLQNDLFTFAE